MIRTPGTEHLASLEKQSPAVEFIAAGFLSSYGLLTLTVRHRTILRKETADVDRQRFAVGFRHVRDGYTNFLEIYAIQSDSPGNCHKSERLTRLHGLKSILLVSTGGLFDPRRKHHRLVAGARAHSVLELEKRFGRASRNRGGFEDLKLKIEKLGWPDPREFPSESI